jgi:hypothetical protein
MSHVLGAVPGKKLEPPYPMAHHHSTHVSIKERDGLAMEWCFARCPGIFDSPYKDNS